MLLSGPDTVHIKTEELGLSLSPSLLDCRGSAAYSLVICALERLRETARSWAVGEKAFVERMQVSVGFASSASACL